MFSSTGQAWLGIASRPIVAITADSASRSGIPAATSAPKAITRMTIVTGSESRPARSRSLLNFSSTCFSALTPNSSIERAGCAAAAPSTAAITGSILSTALSESPRMSKFTTAE